MLLEIAIANCYSYAEKQVLSLVASSGNEHENINVAHVQAARQHRLLKCISSDLV